MFHKWKNELKKLLVKLSRSWTVHLYTNITQGLPAEPGGRADRASMISFSNKPTPKLIAVGNACCRTWLFGVCGKNFYSITIAFGASPNHQQWVQSQHWYLPLQGVEPCGKAQPGKQSCAGGKWAGGGESRPSAFEVERAALRRYSSLKLGAREMRPSAGSGFWASGKWAVALCNTEGVDSPCLPAGPRAFHAGAEIRNTAGCNAALTSHDKCQLC